MKRQSIDDDTMSYCQSLPAAGRTQSCDLLCQTEAASQFVPAAGRTQSCDLLCQTGAASQWVVFTSYHTSNEQITINQVGVIRMQSQTDW